MSNIPGVRVYRKFNGVDSEYFATIKISPTTYGYIHTNSIIVRDLDVECYKIQRDIEYRTFGFLKDRFYAGLLSIYADIFKSMYNKAYDEKEFTNLFACAFETDNDMQNKVLSFDIIFIEANDESDLLKNEYLKDLVKKYSAGDQSKHSAVFNYGKLYKDAVAKLNLLDNVYHLKAFKIQDEGMHRVKLPSGIYYNTNNSEDVEFVNNLLDDDSDLLKYIIGLSKEEKNNE